MKERDNRDIQFTHLAMENVRLQNLVLDYEEELRLRDEEDAAGRAQMDELLASKVRTLTSRAVRLGQDMGTDIGHHPGNRRDDICRC